MNLNKNNWFARYYNWIYNDFPNDVCTFFWGTLFAVILSPFFIPGKLLSDDYDSLGDTFGKGLACWMLFGFCMAVGLIPVGHLEFLKGIQSLPTIIYLLALSLIGAISLALCITIVVGLYFLNEKIRKNRKPKPHDYQSFSEKTGDFIGAIRGKYCTKITWK